MGAANSIHRSMFDAIKSRNFDELRDVYHTDYVYTDSGGAEHKGADAGVAVAELYTSAFSDLEFSIRNEFESGPVSVIEFTARGTHDGPLEDLPATGRAVEMVVCNVIEVLDGLVHREREYYDTYAMLKQLGVAE